jgi:hypothetical protein
LVQTASSLNTASKAFASAVKCDRLNVNNFDYRFARAFVCGVAIASSPGCPARADTGNQVCKDTCVKSVQSLSDSLKKVCGNSKDIEALVQTRLQQCNTFAQRGCVDGSLIEKSNCGKSCRLSNFLSYN